MQRITFKSGNIDLAAIIHRPDQLDPNSKLPALVCVHPGSSVKEQTSGLYARKMADNGYVALSFDASFQGESGGEPRYAENPAARVEDIRSAVDFLMTLDYVDESRVGILGICAGGGYAVNASLTERRIKAVGTVVPINIGAAFRGSGGAEGSAIKMLEAIGEQRTREARGAEPLVINWIPNSQEERERAGIDGLDITEAIDYYRTPRGQRPTSPNLLLYTSLGSVLGFDAFHLVDELLTQPLQVIVGSRVGEFRSYEFGKELFAKAAGEKDMHVIAGASHYDLYDRPKYVELAVQKLRAFYDAHL
jgi:fermentation-respiration switch protein FrsA (DUF1100 family)